MAEQALALSVFRLLHLPRDVQLSILLAFNIRELVICKRMCRSLAQLIDGDISIRYKIELARAGRVDGAPSAVVTVVDRLASLHARLTRFRAGDYPLTRLRGRPFGSWDALSSNGFVTTVSEGDVHIWRPAAASSVGELKIGPVERLGPGRDAHRAFRRQRHVSLLRHGLFLCGHAAEEQRRVRERVLEGARLRCAPVGGTVGLGLGAAEQVSAACRGGHAVGTRVHAVGPDDVHVRRRAEGYPVCAGRTVPYGRVD